MARNGGSFSAVGFGERFVFAEFRDRMAGATAGLDDDAVRRAGFAFADRGLACFSFTEPGDRVTAIVDFAALRFDAGTFAAAGDFVRGAFEDAALDRDGAAEVGAFSAFRPAVFARFAPAGARDFGLLAIVSLTP